MARFGVIGAGLSGLAAARTLHAAGHEVVVVEKSRGVGGRIASRRVDGTVVDHGTPTIVAPPGSALRRAIDALPTDDLVELGGDAVAYRPGLTRLAKLMAEDVTVTLGVRIAALRHTSGGFELAGEQGNTHGSVDGVVISAPAPQARDLLTASGLASPAAALGEIAYDPAVMILAGVRVDPGADADRAAPPAPFAALRTEARKGRLGDSGCVPVAARLDPATSGAVLDAHSDEEILERYLPIVLRSVGCDDPAAWIQVKRWRYAIVRTPRADVVDPGVNLALCGDALTGDGLAAVYDTGVRAAHRLLEGAAR